MAGWPGGNPYSDNWNYEQNDMGYDLNNQQLNYGSQYSDYSQYLNQMPYQRNRRSGSGAMVNQRSANLGYDYLGLYDEYVPPEAPNLNQLKKRKSRRNPRLSYGYEENYGSQLGAHSSYVAPEASWLQNDQYSTSGMGERSNNLYSTENWSYEGYGTSMNKNYPITHENPDYENTVTQEEFPNPEIQEESKKIDKPSHESDPDDFIISEKHQTILKSAQNKEFLTKIIKLVMYAIRDASEILSSEFGANSNHAEDSNEASSSKGADNNKSHISSSSRPHQVLLGVIRSGPAVKKLLHSDTPHLGEILVLVFKCKPTKKQFTRVGEILEGKMSTQLSNKVTVKVKESEEVIEITTSATKCPHPIVLRFTSPLYGKNSIDGESSLDMASSTESELLNKQKCVEALALIRRIRWSLNKIHEDRERPLVRIFIEMSTRLSGWKALTPYAVEVLVYTVTEMLSKIVRPSELGFGRIFRKTLEVLAQGILFPTGPGVKDPCEAEPTDVFSYLTPQETEDLTEAAQNALRWIECDRLCDLLGMNEEI